MADSDCRFVGGSLFDAAFLQRRRARAAAGTETRTAPVPARRLSFSRPLWQDYRTARRAPEAVPRPCFCVPCGVAGSSVANQPSLLFQLTEYSLWRYLP